MSANAGLIYDEAISGDLLLQDDGNWLLLEFEEGANYVRGSDSFQSPTSRDTDVFRFSLPTGTKLESIIYTYEASSSSPIFRDVSGFTFHDISGATPAALGGIEIISYAEVAAGAVKLFEDYLPHAGSEFLIGNNLSGFVTPSVLTLNYSYLFQVSRIAEEVPEPSLVILLASGIVSLVYLRARKKMRLLKTTYP